MNTYMMKLAVAITTLLTLSACDTDFDNPVGNTSSYSAGTADFSKFVSLGDSLTAGYADSALYLSGQQNSYPAVLARQFATVGGGSFVQPLMSDNLGGLLFGGNPNPAFANRLILDAATSTPEPIAGAPTTEVTSVITGPFNNMGVPGAKSFHLGSTSYGNPAGLSGGTANPYYVRMASTSSSSMILDAASQLASFFVLWIGNNDVLSYATTGGIGTNQTGNTDPTTYGSNDITDPNVFASVFNSYVTAFTTVNANVKGVLVNIPDVSSIPFFTTVPYNPVPLDQATADALNAAYLTYNGGIQGALAGTLISADEAANRTITFAAGVGNSVVIEDESLTTVTGLPKYRQATASDLIVLTASSKIGTEDVTGDPSTTWGLGKPLTDGDVLIPAEIAEINTARTAYNTTIKTIADASPNLLFLDAASLLAGLKANGIDYGTGVITSTYATGGGFSLDGVHPTARGYAVVANAIIDTINSGFGASVPKTDPGSQTTIFLK